MKTRIAPSPTGMFHLGTARTAYFNWLAAKANHGQFILRIDDTDVDRNKEEYYQIIFESLEWLGLEPDATVYQSDRIRTGLYAMEAKWLLRSGKAFEAENGAIILRVPETMPKYFTDSIAGNIPITDTNRTQIDGKVVLLRGYSQNPETKIIDKTKLGTPTYQFASTLDDYLMGITWIIRGTDHISNTPKQIAIWRAFDESYANLNGQKDLPKFTHVGLIFNKDENNISKKLSKRDNAASLMWYKEQGFSADAVLNFILRMGWGINDDIWSNKIITKPQAVELFNKGILKSSPANMDLAKLNDLNKYYQAS